MKKSLLFVISLMALQGAMAQSFSVENDEGVLINYYVNSNSGTCTLLSGSYTGRLVVPDSVVYEGMTYTVTQVTTEAFRNNGVRNKPSQVTYLSLPSTITYMGYNCFKNATFDSVRFRCATPPSIEMNRALFDANPQFPVYVPCGSLAAYHEFCQSTTYSIPTGWGRAFKMLRSDCAVPIVGVSQSPYVTIQQDGFYEMGDTAILMYLDSTSYHQSSTEDYPLSPKFLGWSDGCLSVIDTFVVTGPDSIRLYNDALVMGEIDGNLVSTKISAYGTIGYDGYRSTYEVPAGGGVGTVYASTVWAAGHLDGDDVQQGNVHVAAQKFTSDYQPGPLRVTDAKTTIDTKLAYNRVWVVDRAMIDDFIAHVGEAGYQIPEAIASWPGNGDTAQGYAAQLAPYYDANHDGRYNPRNGDYPLIRGDRALFSIFNDSRTGSSLGGQPMGLEVHAMYYLFDEPQDWALQYTLFADYTFYNRSQNDYDSTRLTAWADFDLGYAHDDYMGCDVQHNTFYAYNGDEVDGPADNAYIGIPPAQGCTMLGVKDAQMTGHPMDVFMYYVNATMQFNGEPSSARDHYRYINGIWKDGQSMYYGNDGYHPTADSIPCRYMFPGDSDPDYYGTYGIPVDSWTEASAGNTPNDRRGLGSTGTFTMEAGHAYTLSVAHTTAFSQESAWASVEQLAIYNAHIQQLYDRDTTDAGKAFTYMPYSAPREDGIEGVAAEQRLSVYPNPATASVRIEGLKPGTQVQVYNMQGSLVLAVAYDGSSLDLSQLATGIYLIATPQGHGKVCKR